MFMMHIWMNLIWNEMNYTMLSCNYSWCCGVVESSWGGVLVGVVVGCMVKMHHFSVVGLYVDIYTLSLITHLHWWGLMPRNVYTFNWWGLMPWNASHSLWWGLMPWDALTIHLVGAYAPECLALNARSWYHICIMHQSLMESCIRSLRCELLLVRCHHKRCCCRCCYLRWI